MLHITTRITHLIASHYDIMRITILQIACYVTSNGFTSRYRTLHRLSLDRVARAPFLETQMPNSTFVSVMYFGFPPPRGRRLAGRPGARNLVSSGAGSSRRTREWCLRALLSSKLVVLSSSQKLEVNSQATNMDCSGLDSSGLLLSRGGSYMLS